MRHCILTSHLCRLCRAGHPRHPVVTAPVHRGCLSRENWGASDAQAGWHREQLWLRCVRGGGHVLWAFLIHALQTYLMLLAEHAAQELLVDEAATKGKEGQAPNVNWCAIW